MKGKSIKSDPAILDRLYEVIQQRKAALQPESYVSGLFLQGKEKMHAKIAEESAELIAASREASREGIIHETADLLFHLMVLLGTWDIAPAEIYSELERRWGVSGITEKQSRNAKTA